MENLLPLIDNVVCTPAPSSEFDTGNSCAQGPSPDMVTTYNNRKRLTVINKQRFADISTIKKYDSLRVM